MISTNQAAFGVSAVGAGISPIRAESAGGGGTAQHHTEKRSDTDVSRCSRLTAGGLAMSDTASIAMAQREFWNGEATRRWVIEQARLDRLMSNGQRPRS